MNTAPRSASGMPMRMRGSPNTPSSTFVTSSRSASVHSTTRHYLPSAAARLRNVAVRAIRIMGDPVLHAPAVAVDEITDEIRTLVADMYETMDAAPGVGLAAPQIGVPLRIF